MQEKTQGFIIKIINHNDSSKLVTLYTTSLGKITVAANIPEKISNGNIGLFDIGNAVNVVLYRKTEDEMYKISEISLLKQYYNIHFDYDKLCVLNYICYALNANNEEFYGDRTMMNFLKKYMNFLNNSSLEYDYLIFLFDYYFLLINGVIEEFYGLDEIEKTFVNELSGCVMLEDSFQQYISTRLIKKMNQMKKTKIKILDTKK